MVVKTRNGKPASPAPESPIEWARADPVALEAFDPASKTCTMNCGPHGLDPRSSAERKFLCDDCMDSELKGAQAMIHLVMAVVDYECRDPVRAFATPEEAKAYLAVVQAHQRTRPSVLTLADDEVDDWESLLREWEDKHPAPGHGSANRFEIETIPLGFE